MTSVQLRQLSMAEHMPSCSVVVCTRDRPQTLSVCLAAVARESRYVSEIIVVDSGPLHASAELVARRWGAKYVCESSSGLSRARNRGASEAESDIVVFMDDDAIPEVDWLEPLLAEFADAEVALAASRVLPMGDDERFPAWCKWTGMVDKGPVRQLVDRSVPDWFGLTNFGGFWSNCFAIRRIVFDTWAGFDQRLGVGTRIYGGEESKAFFELAARGYRLVYVPCSVVRHPLPLSPEMFNERSLRAIEASAAYLTLMLCEQSEYRKETMSYVLGKLRRITPIYRREAHEYPSLVSGYRVLFARLRGVFLYLATRLST